MMSRLDDLVAQLGFDKSCEILQRHLAETEEPQQVLTIVANRGVHHLPADHLHGEVFYASEGNLDFSSDVSVRLEHERVLSAVAQKLKSKKWNRIYIIPFGPNTLCMQIKLIVYRITRLESIDLFYTGDGKYFDLNLDQRSIIVSAK